MDVAAGHCIGQGQKDHSGEHQHVTLSRMYDD